MVVLRAAVAAFVSASCAARDDGAEDATTGAAMFEIEDCDELLTQTDCESAPQSGIGDKCAWLDVRVPQPSCSSDTVAPQCVGMSYVGEGCQLLECTDELYVDGFFRMVDGHVEIFANPPTECGLIANVDGWSACVGSDMPNECGCLCPA